MINFNYNKEDELLEVEYVGLLTEKNFSNYLNNISSNKNLPKNLKILTDARRVIYDFETIDFSLLIKKIEIHTKQFNIIKNAILHSKPRETAVSIMVEDEIDIKKYKQKVFYTKAVALNWLNKN